MVWDKGEDEGRLITETEREGIFHFMKYMIKQGYMNEACYSNGRFYDESVRGNEIIIMM